MRIQTNLECEEYYRANDQSAPQKNGTTKKGGGGGKEQLQITRVLRDI